MHIHQNAIDTRDLINAFRALDQNAREVDVSISYLYNSDTSIINNFESYATNASVNEAISNIFIDPSVYININAYATNSSVNTSFNFRDRTHSTGVYNFSGVIINSSTRFSIPAFDGYIVNNSSTNVQITYINYEGSTNISSPYINNSIATYVLIDSSKAVKLLNLIPTPEERRANIYLGKISHPNYGTFQNMNNTPSFEISSAANLEDIMTPLKLINQNIICSPFNTSMSIKSSAGILWGLGINYITNKLNPNSISISAKNPVTFQYRTRNTSTNVIDTSIISAGYYDYNGVITALPAGAKKSSNQRIYLFPTNVIRIQYGQQYYDNLNDAVAGALSEAFIENVNMANSGILLGVLSVRRSASDLSNIEYAKFIPVSKFGELTGGNLGFSTATLQSAYNNSTPPQIITNSINDGVVFQCGDSSNNLPVIKTANMLGNITSYITGSGDLFANSINAYTIKTLSNNIDTSIFSIDISSNSSKAGSIHYSLSITDASDFQIKSGYINYTCINKNNVYYTNIDNSCYTYSSVASSGTIADLWTISTSTNKFFIKNKPSSSLTPTNIQLQYTLMPGVNGLFNTL